MEAESVETPQEAVGSGQQSDIAQKLQALAEDAVDLDAINADPGLESDMEVPESSFWDGSDSSSDVLQEEEPEIAPVGDVPESSDQTISYKANGQELQITLDEARKKLAMAEGGAQAFTKLGQANKKLSELESRIPDLEKKASLLDKLEEVKHDWKAVLQIATGQNADDFLAEAMRKQRILETGSDADRVQLEKEERFAQLERQLQAQAEKQEQLEKQDQERSYSTEKAGLKNMLESEFFKHKFSLDNDIASNDVNELLWQQGQRRMTQYVKKYQDHPKFKELLPKMAQKSFDDVAGKLNRLTTGSVQTQVDRAIQQKKANAQEKAAVASTRSLGDPNSDSFKGLSIREIADKLVGKKRFSF